MKHKKVVYVVALLGGCAGYWYFSSEPAPALAQVETSAVQAVVATQQSQVVKPMQSKQVMVKETLPESVSERFSLLADAYAEELTLPAYSVPLSVNDEHLLNPNQYVAQPVMLEGGASASIVMPKYRFSFPEPVIITLEVDGLTVTGVSAALQSELSANTEVLAKGDMADQNGKWTVKLDATEEWDGPMEVNVTFSAKGKKQTLTTGIEYSYPTATITGIGEVRAEGSDMLIPLKITVEKAGYYRVRANLYTTNQQPVALLTASKKLSEGAVEMDLKAYKGVLPKQDGEFTLGSFVLERRPAVPGELTRYGRSNEPSYDLGEFAVEQLSDEPWQPDEQEIQRLEFLQKMATP
ncbi:hypothetical protein [Shewanella ulleungensis]|uniref:Uncharacterized protein n=1 Tax=Shewanella ulleungensis TaxID=2282699 RepID=A0ABQ2QU01_9GAMM|nr:hypothetical protein [Shewanella ulleungensis]MCL1150681.1 hypothetical protein [Shewanella ulleungensis]GGP94425.1 hypothetical protein GCM10009410_30570 [Shewanella ulleungensis]